MFRRKSVFIFALLFAFLLAPGSATAFTDSQAFMVNLLSDALALGPSQLRTPGITDLNSLRRHVSHFISVTKGGRRDADEHFEYAAAVQKDSEKSADEKFDELAALTFYLVSAVSPRCSPKFYSELESSTDVFIAEFDGAQPFTGKYSEHIRHAADWSKKYREELEKACREYNPRNATIVAQDSAILYNFLVNETIDTWFTVLTRADALHTQPASRGTQRSFAPSEGPISPKYALKEKIDIVKPLRDFRSSEPGAPHDKALSVAAAPVPARETATPTSPKPVPKPMPPPPATTTTTMRPTTTTIPPAKKTEEIALAAAPLPPPKAEAKPTPPPPAVAPPKALPPPVVAPAPVHVFIVATTTTTTTTMISPARAKPTPPPGGGSDLIVLGGLEITSADAKAAKTRYNQEGLEIENDLGNDSALKIDSEISPTQSGSGVSNRMAQSKLDDEIKSGEVTVVFDSLGSAGYIPIGEKKKQRIVLGSVTPIDDASAPGSINPKVLVQIIQQNLGGVRNCYERFLKFNPRLAGRFYVEITIGADGAVTNVAVLDDTVHYPELTDCLVKRIYGWKFPPPAGGSFKFSYPFTFVQGF